MSQFNSDLSTLTSGAARGCRDNCAFAEIVRAPDGTLHVDCGWVVPEADEDDHGSSTHHPFKGGGPRPWVGRRVVVTSDAEALATYAEFRAGIWGGQRPTRGEIIGSVSR